MEREREREREREGGERERERERAREREREREMKVRAAVHNVRRVFDEGGEREARGSVFSGGIIKSACGAGRLERRI